MDNIFQGKDFKNWHMMKERIHIRKNENKIYFHEGEIWWCQLGVNIGFEQDGKGKYCSRPVIVLKKFNQGMVWVIPFTTKLKSYPYCMSYLGVDGKSQVILIPQLRLISSKRLTNKIGLIDKNIFAKIKKIIRELL